MDSVTRLVKAGFTPVVAGEIYCEYMRKNQADKLEAFIQSCECYAEKDGDE